jgi:hypothetical protein
MKNIKQEQSRLKRSVPKKVRKNAVSKKLIVVNPGHGIDELRAGIGDPFVPMDFREIVAQAKQRNPKNVDGAYDDIVRETTSEQLSELLSALHINSDGNNSSQQAFCQLACALLNVGLVVWTPLHRRQTRSALQRQADLYWIVKYLTEREGLSERKSIKKIADTSLFPYRPQRRSQLSSSKSGRFDTLWQAWMKAKRRKDEILALGPPKAFEGMLGEKLGQQEVKLVVLDIKHASKSGKKRPR